MGRSQGKPCSEEKMALLGVIFAFVAASSGRVQEGILLLVGSFGTRRWPEGGPFISLQSSAHPPLVDRRTPPLAEVCGLGGIHSSVPGRTTKMFTDTVDTPNFRGSAVSYSACITC